MTRLRSPESPDPWVHPELLPLPSTRDELFERLAALLSRIPIATPTGTERVSTCNGCGSIDSQHCPADCWARELSTLRHALELVER